MKSPRLTVLRQARGRAARIAGRRGEIAAALLLMAKGYRILGFRLKTPHGEIDILAARGRVLAVVEVKLRMSREEALAAVSATQQQRLLRAGAALAARRAGLRNHRLRLDLMALTRGKWPRHVVNAWAGEEPR